ncbi:hypothetical protein [Caproicibacter fermentans]|uniref:DNA polymerase Y-family little finger domain-containing protein n=2 Tax=Caproicibacter fermentans TaxID=2576756 RepID=A0A7G8T7X7_9FIRM|nr:hypothetical protein [Caproicibacter fermentans]QNK39718.1 hypothetical protein HCR03_13425 [Caproicibacter fermentans]
MDGYRWERPIRSIGISMTDLVPDTVPSQGNLYRDEAGRERLKHLDRAVDRLKNRFGSFAVQPAVLLNRKE